jgi:hypothetical protein
MNGDKPCYRKFKPLKGSMPTNRRQALATL